MPTDSASAARPRDGLQLLDTSVVRKLLASAIPASVAYTAEDGTPRIVSTWGRWTNGELVMPTYIQAPHIPAPGARRLGARRARPDVAISIDTGTEPPQALLICGTAHMAEVDGVDSDYAAAAREYLGEDAAREPPRRGRPARHPHGPDHPPSRRGGTAGLRWWPSSRRDGRSRCLIRGCCGRQRRWRPPVPRCSPRNVLHAGSGGKVRAAGVGVRDRRPVAELTMNGIGRYRGHWTLDPGWFNEAPGVVFREGDHIPGVVSFAFDGDSLATPWLLVNPNKMNALKGVRV